MEAWAAAAPLLCAAHCIAAPLLVALAPGLAGAEEHERMMMSIAVCLALLGTGLGVRVHGRPAPLSIVGAGALLWIVTPRAPFVPEAAATLAASLLMAAGAAWGARLRHRAACPRCACPAHAAAADDASRPAPGASAALPSTRPGGKEIRRALFTAALALAVLPASVDAQASVARASIDVPAARAAATGALHGRVTDGSTGQPVAGATVRIREVGRRDVSHADGAFHFDGLPAGSYTVAAERIGYAPAQQTVRVVDGLTANLALSLAPSALQLSAVVATGTGRERGGQETYRPTIVVGGAELRRQLGATVTATVAGEPGIAMRYNGPAASQPIIRGLGGDRVLVLEDGQRTGDIAGSAADHGVMVEPLTAERIEVVRGPAGLLYGSNALGGVINVIREEVPRSRPDRLSGALSLQGESASQGFAGGASLLGGLGGWALRGEASARRAGDTRTPLGDLPSTDLRGYSVGASASRVGAGGFAGLAVRDYAMEHGVPGTFGGVDIAGAHQGGVELEVRRTAVRGQAAYLDRVGPFGSIEADLNLVRFRHHEMERGTDGSQFVGTSFLQHTGTMNLVGRHRHEGTFRNEGAVGLWAFGKDLEVGGLATGSRSARQWSLAGFIYEEVSRGRWGLELGARYDWTRIVPEDDRPVAGISVGTRDFGAFSGSAATVYRLGGGWQAGARLARSFRTPSIEELYSRGPHLAAYSYEIGNPQIDPETGLGADVFVRVARPGVEGELTAYRNRIDGFIYYRPTGALDPRFGRYPVYQARGDDARFTGMEGRIQVEPLRAWVVEATGSYVRGDLRGEGGWDPLPAIPPAHGALRIRRDVPRWFAEAGVESGARQDRVYPGTAPDGTPLEPPTAGYTLLNASAGVRWDARGALHTLTLSADNLTDAVWRDHLSRIRAVAPQPGLNLRLLYRVDF
ncbi:MAG TPA: TonB-dependent receptor [Longimicrobium sp.]|nr:TonB-dependent receptor [Longimicrobium sp.]